MSKKSSDWYVPPDIAFLLSFYFILPIILLVSGTMLPLLARFKSGDLAGVFYSALALGAVGTVLLFFARLPLYRKRQFLGFGPGQLDGIHRRLYWVAYLFVAVSVFPFIIFAFWIVYRSFCTDEMDYRDIWGLEVRPRALWRALLAELCLIIGMMALRFMMALVGPPLGNLSYKLFLRILNQ